MKDHTSYDILSVRRRPSQLSEAMREAKLERARRMTPEGRLELALELSDFCLELKDACSKKL
jgi:hypothetical protein